MSSVGNIGQAGREDGYVAVHLSQGTPNFPPVPIELQSYISREEWDRRLTAISQLSRRYSKPIFERIWIFLGFMLMLAAPIIVYRVLADNILRQTFVSDSDFQQLSEFRLIAFGIFVAMLIVIWGPFFMWKGIGRYRMQTLIKEWNQIDVLAKNKGIYVPVWTVALPSGYSNSTIVRVSIPPRTNPSYFHPDAYLPPYIAPPQYVPGYSGYNQGATPFQEVKI